MIRRISVVLALALSACGGAPADEPVAPGATVSYTTDAGRAEVEVRYPDSGIVRGANRFRFRPTSGARLTSVQATMPAHGHRVTGALGADGDAVLADVELAMPGRWELSADVASDAGADVLRISFVVP